MRNSSTIAYLDERALHDCQAFRSASQAVAIASHTQSPGNLSAFSNPCSTFGELEDVSDETAPSRPAFSAAEVFHEHAARVYSFARRMLGNDADAEDATQDVLLQVVRWLDTFRGESSLSTWLYRVTVNAALAIRRKQAASRERQLADAMDGFGAEDTPGGQTPPWCAEPAQQVMRRELNQIIEESIARLPTIYRDTYVLSDVEGVPNGEIGEILGLSLPAVKSRLHRARLLMREALTPYFEEIKG